MVARIASILPAATEIICALDLRTRLVGVSHECDHPEDVRSLPILSEAPETLGPAATSAEIDREVRELLARALAIYRVRTDVLETARPDLIVTQDHCDVCAVSLEAVERACARLTGATTRIVSLRSGTLAQIARDFMAVAEAAHVRDRGEALVARFRAQLAAVRGRTEGARRPKIACIEWLAPPMIAGGWLPELVELAGGEPLFVRRAGEHFRTTSWVELAAADPDVVVLFPCGFPIDRTLKELEDERLRDHLISLRATKEGRTFVADGNAFFNRPGPRIADSAEILAGILHPTRSPQRSGAIPWP